MKAKRHAVAREGIEETPHDQRFSGAHLACDDDESFLPQDPVLHDRKGLFVLRRGIEEKGVGLISNGLRANP